MRDYLDTYAHHLDAQRAIDPETKLSGYEIRVLWMMDGGPTLDWGAAMSVSCEHLAGRGFCTRGPNFQITDAGRQVLAAIKATDAPCSVCGNEERGQGGYLSCECPARTTKGLDDA